MLYLYVRRQILVGPVITIAIDPDRAQSGFACAVNIMERMVANVQRLFCPGSTGLYCGIEY